MSVTVKSFAVCVLGTVSKGLEKGLKEMKIRVRIRNIQTTSKYWEESWRPEVTCCLSDSFKRPPAYASVKNISECSKPDTTG